MSGCLHPRAHRRRHPVKFSPGAPQVTINAPQNVVSNLTTAVKNGTLIVALKPNVIVTSMEGTEVLIMGAGVVAVEATGASTLDVSVIGAPSAERRLAQVS